MGLWRCLIARSAELAVLGVNFCVIYCGLLCVEIELQAVTSEVCIWTINLPLLQILERRAWSFVDTFLSCEFQQWRRNSLWATIQSSVDTRYAWQVRLVMLDGILCRTKTLPCQLAFTNSAINAMWTVWWHTWAFVSCSLLHSYLTDGLNVLEICWRQRWLCCVVTIDIGLLGVILTAAHLHLINLLLLNSLDLLVIVLHRWKWSKLQLDLLVIRRPTFVKISTVPTSTMLILITEFIATTIILAPKTAIMHISGHCVHHHFKLAVLIWILQVTRLSLQLSGWLWCVNHDCVRKWLIWIVKGVVVIVHSLLVVSRLLYIANFTARWSLLDWTRWWLIYRLQVLITL